MKLGTLIRHAFKLKTENIRVYSSFMDYFETFSTFEYTETMGFFAHRKEFKSISQSLFVFKNKAHSYAHLSCRVNPLDFTQAIAVPTDHALKKYKELISSFGFVINPGLKQIDETKKQEVFKIYEEINDIVDNLPESIQQTMKAK